MSLETDVYAVLQTVCPRVFPDVAPANTAMPYITWQQIGGDVIATVTNDLPDKRNALVQVNCWSSTRLEANQLALQVEVALVGAGQFVAIPRGAFTASFDDDVDGRGTMQDFSIWASR